MIQLSYKEISGIDKKYIFEGYVTPVADRKISVNTEWNGEQYTVQNIFYDNYSFSVVLRDDEYREFQKIQYANEVIFDNQNQIQFTGKINKFTANPYLSEFWKIDVEIYNLRSKKIENKIKENDFGELQIEYQELLNYKINLPVIRDYDLTRNIITEFKDSLSDFRKTTDTFKIRFYLTPEEMSLFVEALRIVSYNSTERIVYLGSRFWQYNFKKTNIGNNLFQIDLILFNENKITP